MTNKAILSICIPTYNRGEKLIELVKTLLKSDSNSFEIEITDNASTDNTLSILSNIGDPRIIIHQNDSNIGGAANMIKSIFNVRNKYALFCNDRDSINVENLEKLIEFLRNNDLSYVKVLESKVHSDNPIKYYDSGSDSILHQTYTFHPSGCVFNCEIIKKLNLNASDYIMWAGTEKYCRLAWDLMSYGKTATVEFAVWEYASFEYYGGNASGFQTKQNSNRKKVYFHPYEREKNMRLIMQYLLVESKHFTANNEIEKGLIAVSIADEFYRNLSYYKYNACSKYETCHYQIKPHFVCTAELLNLYKHYFFEVISVMNRCKVGESFIKLWKDSYYSRAWKLIKKSFLYDVLFLKKIVCRQSW